MIPVATGALDAGPPGTPARAVVGHVVTATQTIGPPAPGVVAPPVGDPRVVVDRVDVTRGETVEDSPMTGVMNAVTPSAVAQTGTPVFGQAHSVPASERND